MSQKPLDIVSAFQSYGEFIAGRITDEQRADIVRNACPGAGACGGMYTANSSKYRYLFPSRSCLM
jgi:dihydroxy-acid dehydratase